MSGQGLERGENPSASLLCGLGELIACEIMEVCGSKVI